MAEKSLPSLDGLIQTKGAPRPDALIQRVEAPSPARALQDGLQAAMTPPPVAPAPMPVIKAATALDREPRAKSLTLRLSETQYERLRRFAFDSRQSHQDIIEQALMEHLEKHASQ
jgi:hypothetical protein